MEEMNLEGLQRRLQSAADSLRGRYGSVVMRMFGGNFTGVAVRDVNNYSLVMAIADIAPVVRSLHWVLRVSAREGISRMLHCTLGESQS